MSKLGVRGPGRAGGSTSALGALFVAAPAMAFGEAAGAPFPGAPSPGRRIDPWAGRGRKGLGLAAGAAAAAWTVGLWLLVAADGHVTVTLPRRRSPPAAEHNLAAWDLGPTVRASSYFRDWSSQHHAAFLVDGRAQPGLVEKWASAARDRRPWIEITWREPHDLARVVLTHAGRFEDESLTVRRYRLTCLRAGGGPSVAVAGNQQAVAAHALVCPGARGVRVDLEPNDDSDVVRVFEVEAWGR